MPRNWRDLRAEIAYGFGFPPSEVGRLTGAQLVEWAEQLERIHGRLLNQRGHHGR